MKHREGVRTRNDIDMFLGNMAGGENKRRFSRPPVPPQPGEPPPIKTTTIKLRAALPVYIAYFTAIPGPDGSVSFLPDIYGRDGLIIDPAKPGKSCSAAATAQAGDLRKPPENGNQGDPGP